MPPNAITFAGSESYSLPPEAVRAGPFAAVRLQHQQWSHSTIGLVDSGADGSLFHLDWAKALHLDLNAGEAGEGDGIGGKVAVWYFRVYLTVLGRRFPARVGFTTSSRRGFGLLGRRDFFAQFDIGVQEQESRFLYLPR